MKLYWWGVQRLALSAWSAVAAKAKKAKAFLKSPASRGEAVKLAGTGVGVAVLWMAWSIVSILILGGGRFEKVVPYEVDSKIVVALSAASGEKLGQEAGTRVLVSKREASEVLESGLMAAAQSAHSRTMELLSERSAEMKARLDLSFGLVAASPSGDFEKRSAAYKKDLAEADKRLALLSESIAAQEELSKRLLHAAGLLSEQVYKVREEAPWRWALLSGVAWKIQASAGMDSCEGLLCWRRDAYAGFVKELSGNWAVHFLLTPFLMMVLAGVAAAVLVLLAAAAKASKEKVKAAGLEVQGQKEAEREHAELLDEIPAATGKSTSRSL